MRIAEFVARYHDLPLGTVDASVCGHRHSGSPPLRGCPTETRTSVCASSVIGIDEAARPISVKTENKRRRIVHVRADRSSIRA
jgi:hypothetical protein